MAGPKYKRWYSYKAAQQPYLDSTSPAQFPRLITGTCEHRCLHAPDKIWCLPSISLSGPEGFLTVKRQGRTLALCSQQFKSVPQRL